MSTDILNPGGSVISRGDLLGSSKRGGSVKCTGDAVFRVNVDPGAEMNVISLFRFPRRVRVFHIRNIRILSRKHPSVWTSLG